MFTMMDEKLQLICNMGILYIYSDLNKSKQLAAVKQREVIMILIIIAIATITITFLKHSNAHRFGICKFHDCLFFGA